jgi:transmembrane sensor
VSDAEQIEALAAEWLMQRDAAPHAEDTEFTAWLAADPRHRAAYLRLAAAWERTTQLKRLRPEGRAIDPDLLRPRKPSWWRRGGGRPFALAAGIAVAILSVVAWMARPSVQVYRTDIGGLSRIILGDGSTVTLNTDTELRVRLLPERRELRLVRGEAQFSVAHDVNRPFEVSAAGRVVRAVGTAFDVRLDQGESMEVTVTQGRVALLPQAESARPTGMLPTVSAGETAVSIGGKVTVRRVSATESSRHLAWQVGELSFEGESLAEAVAEFNRYNRRKLTIDDPEVAALQIGGNFQALDVDSFVAALGRSFGVSSRVNADGTLTLERVQRSTHD